MENIEYFIIKNKTSGETGKDATLNGSTFTYLELQEGSPRPEGEVVNELTYEEAKAVLSLPAFSPNYTGIRDYVYIDYKFCLDVELQFDSDSGSLSKENTNALLSLLGGVTLYLDRKSPQHAYTELQEIETTVLFPQVVKDKYLTILENYLNKFPR